VAVLRNWTASGRRRGHFHPIFALESTSTDCQEPPLPKPLHTGPVPVNTCQGTALE
jgi:hypothetical protein